MELIAKVRTKTTDDEEWLPDTIIQSFLEDRINDWMMAAADCLRYMARDDIYDSYSRGAIKVSKPLLEERARELVVDVTTGTGISATMATMTRGDYDISESTPEYINDHPPYSAKQGVMRGGH